MTVSSTTIKTSPYACDGATIDFSFAFAVWETSEVKVILRTVATGEETVLTETTHYSVTLSTSTPSAGYITTVSTYSNAYEIVIIANFPYTQEVDYGEGDTFPASSHEEALDRGVRLVQQLKEKLSRAVLWPESSTLEDIELPEISLAKANYILQVNNAGSALQWGEFVAYGSLTSHDQEHRETVHQNMLADLVADTNESSPGLAIVASDAEVAAGNEATKIVSPAGLASVFEYQEIYVVAGALIEAETNGATMSTQEYEGNGVNMDYAEFGHSLDEEAVEISFPMPETWDRTMLKAKAYWTHTYALALTEGSPVQFGYQIRAVNQASRIDTNWSTPPVYVSDAVVNEATDTLHWTDPTANFASAVAPGNLLNLRITRNNTVANNASAGVWLLGVLFQYRNANNVSGW